MAGLSLTATTAFANSNTDVKVLDVHDNYNNRTVYTKTPVNTCTTVNVPIYQQQKQSSTADVLFGAIIGGVVGNQFGGGAGKDALTALGAIAGADVVAKDRKKQAVIVGYQQQQQCTTTYDKQRSVITEYVNSVITFEYEGQVYKTVFVK